MSVTSSDGTLNMNLGRFGDISPFNRRMVKNRLSEIGTNVEGLSPEELSKLSLYIKEYYLLDVLPSRPRNSEE